MSGKTLQFRGGTTAQHATFVGAQRELTVDITKKVVVVHDGVTPGGLPMVGFSQVGVAGGVAPLGADQKVPAANLPSYVDDVLEYANRAGFPTPGETGKIFVALDTSRQYRWSGSTYVELVASPGTTDDVVEGAANLYYTNARVDARIAAAGLAAANYTLADAAAASTLPAAGTSTSVASLLQVTRNALKWLVARFDSGGNALAAVKLTTPRSFQVNLASTAATSFDGTANITFGVTGALPISSGGTGSTTAAGARTALGLGSLATKSSVTIDDLGNLDLGDLT
ncbi:Uncharacterised protein [Bordetella ansorpii]|uniref:Major tropism determinant N-terminal domain-containing protein n=1 Tax=Bordetella ansorpii TaxID=288768 RepID=A0A157SVT1_9BORD|nr:hypothetical protein [Bordetella ansorpii]SAI74557.1 Uncharacterised protein [Bordetella ansorpii]